MGCDLTEMLRHSPCWDGMSRRDDTKTIKHIVNEAFVASSVDIITDYIDLGPAFLVLKTAFFGDY